jgi:hypothetical protein
VANRGQLDQLVVERVGGTIPIPEPDPDRWYDQLRRLMLDALAAYRAHPGSARAALGMVPTELGALRGAEAMMGCCLAGGVPAQYAAWFCDLAALYIGALAVEESFWQDNNQGAADPEDWEAVGAQLRELFASLPRDQFPILSSHADVMTTGDGEQRLGFALDVLLEGLKAVARR